MEMGLTSCGKKTTTNREMSPRQFDPSFCLLPLQDDPRRYDPVVVLMDFWRKRLHRWWQQALVPSFLLPSSLLTFSRSWREGDGWRLRGKVRHGYCSTSLSLTFNLVPDGNFWSKLRTMRMSSQIECIRQDLWIVTSDRGSEQRIKISILVFL